MMYRLFAALEVPRDVGEELQLISRKVSGASWRPIENYHITLRFFGDLDRKTAIGLDDELARFEAPQMRIRLRSTGWFGGADPDAIWAGIEPNDDLNALAGKCERAARRIGLPREKRPYRPHVTLAYCHHTPVEEVIGYCQKNALLDIGPFWVDRFHLFSSWSGKGPSRYMSEAEYPLGPQRGIVDLPAGNQSSVE